MRPMLPHVLLSLLLLIGLAGCAPASIREPQSPTPASQTPFLLTDLPATTSSTSKQTTPDASPAQSPTPSLTHRPGMGSLPVETASPSSTCKAEAGQLEKGQVATSLLREPLDYRVYLPPCYAAAKHLAYPVLYLIHGHGFNDDQWDRLGADESADSLISSGETPPFMLVMPYERRLGQPDKNMFGRAVVDDLIPYIDSHYRTLPGRSHRAIGGLSRGGGWALHLGLTEWKLFGAFGAHSLAMFSYDRGRISGWLEEIPLAEMPRIFLDMDDHDRKDLIESTLWFENLLTERGIPHEWYLYPGYHEEKYWQAHVEQYLRWYSQGWMEEPQPSD